MVDWQISAPRMRPDIFTTLIRTLFVKPSWIIQIYAKELWILTQASVLLGYAIIQVKMSTVDSALV
jgi:hypothetical protein